MESPKTLLLSLEEQLGQRLLSARRSVNKYILNAGADEEGPLVGIFNKNGKMLFHGTLIQARTWLEGEREPMNCSEWVIEEGTLNECEADDDLPYTRLCVGQRSVRSPQVMDKCMRPHFHRLLVQRRERAAICKRKKKSHPSIHREVHHVSELFPGPDGRRKVTPVSNEKNLRRHVG